jgi:hypothetical protein
MAGKFVRRPKHCGKVKTRKEFFDKLSSLINELKITGAGVVSTIWWLAP